MVTGFWLDLEAVHVPEHTYLCNLNLLPSRLTALQGKIHPAVLFLNLEGQQPKASIPCRFMSFRVLRSRFRAFIVPGESGLSGHLATLCRSTAAGKLMRSVIFCCGQASGLSALNLTPRHGELPRNVQQFCMHCSTSAQSESSSIPITYFLRVPYLASSQKNCHQLSKCF